LESEHCEAGDNHRSNKPFMCGVCEGSFN